ncbi:unnamed protein product [Adineta ricciae]|uniref:Uncharacterized protein n=1 Tax=Adineta ricciae TaxID=249248 RepID=A0A815R9G0_ADIRI|nr:unnamed protein product [Adineta ricciae]
MVTAATCILQFNEWEQEAKTVAGGNQSGEELNQLKYPHGIFIDTNRSIYIADVSYNRIMKWIYNATGGEIIAGENGKGNRTDQLHFPTDTIVDTHKHRVIQWRNQNEQEILLESIWCQGQAMSEDGKLEKKEKEQ